MSLDMDLKGVSKFYVVQADGFEEYEETIMDEKGFDKLQDALAVIKESEAPVKYLKFNLDGATYKCYPIEDSEEYRVTKTPILN